MPTYFLCGLAEIFISALRGIGHSTAPTIAAVGCVCAYRIVWVNTVFVWVRSIQVLFACYPISYVLELIVLPIMFVVFYRRIPSVSSAPAIDDDSLSPAIDDDSAAAIS